MEQSSRYTVGELEALQTAFWEAIEDAEERENKMPPTAEPIRRRAANIKSLRDKIFATMSSVSGGTSECLIIGDKQTLKQALTSVKKGETANRYRGLALSDLLRHTTRLGGTPAPLTGPLEECPFRYPRRRKSRTPNPVAGSEAASAKRPVIEKRQLGDMK